MARIETDGTDKIRTGFAAGGRGLAPAGFRMKPDGTDHPEGAGRPRSVPSVTICLAEGQETPSGPPHGNPDWV